MRENMLVALKKRSLAVSLIYSVIMLAVGLFLVISNMAHVVAVFTGYTPFEALRPEEIKNQLTELDLSACFGPYAEEYNENTSTHVKQITYRYYMLLTGSENDFDYRYMSIRGPVSLTEQMNRIAEASDAGISSEPLHLTGRIYKLNQKEYSILKNVLLSSGWTTKEIEELTLPYCINAFTATDELSNNIEVVFLFGIGAVLVLWSVWRIVRGVRGGNMRKFCMAYETAGFTEAAVAADLTQAFPKTAKARVRVGRLCTYFNLRGQHPALIPNKDMIWAYHLQPPRDTVTIARTKPDPSRRIAIHTLKDKKPRIILFSDLDSAQNALNRISKTMPWIVIGYSEKLEKMLQEDRSGFLGLQYDTVAHVAQEPAAGAEEGAIARIARYSGS